MSDRAGRSDAPRSSAGSDTGAGAVAPAASSGPAATSRAVPALVLAVAGFACCGLPALAGAVLARRELAAIDAGRADPAGRGTARLALVLGGVTAALWLCGVVGYVLLLVESGFVR